MARKSFSVHSDYYDEIRRLTSEQRGELFLALIGWASGEEAHTDPECGVLLRLMIAQTERISFANSANGMNGGRPPKSEKTEKTEKTEKSEAEEEKRKKPTVSDTVTDTITRDNDVDDDRAGGRAREDGDAGDVNADIRGLAAVQALAVSRVEEAVSGIGMPFAARDAEEAERLIADHSLDWVLAAVGRAADRGPSARSWGFIKGILRSWRAAGGIDDPMPPTRAPPDGRPGRVPAQQYAQREYGADELDALFEKV